MAQLPGAFDATAVDPGETYDVLPAGDYIVQIVQSELRPTKSGDGQRIWLELDVLEGPHTGRKIWDNINIINPNPQAQQIAHKILAQICNACGVAQATDSEQFHFKPMLAKVKIQPASGNYDASNQIKSYRAVENAPHLQQQQHVQQPAAQQQAQQTTHQQMFQQPPAAQQPAAQTSPAGGGGMPWDRPVTG